MRLSHEYDDRIVELSMWLVDSFTGEPAGLDGQGLKWVAPEALGHEDILEADAPFVRRCRSVAGILLNSEQACTIYVRKLTIPETEMAAQNDFPTSK